MLQVAAACALDPRYRSRLGVEFRTSELRGSLTPVGQPYKIAWLPPAPEGGAAMVDVWISSMVTLTNGQANGGWGPGC